MTSELMLINKELNSRSNLVQFERILGRRGAASFISGILTSCKDNPKLLECPPENIAGEALKGAAYNLPIGSSFGMSWLVPRWSSKHQSQMATWQPGYKGLKQLAMRSKDHVIINVDALYPGQHIEQNQLTGQVQIIGENKGGEPIGYFGYLRKVNGYEGFVYWAIDKILEHKALYAKGTDRKDSPWKSSPISMYKKTVLTSLLKEHATLEFDLDEVAGDVLDTTTDGEDDAQLEDGVIDGEIIEEEMTKFNPREWSDDKLDAIVAASLEENILTAKDTLNRSELPETSAVSTCVNWYRHYRKTVDEFGSTDEAVKCANEAYNQALKNL